MADNHLEKEASAEEGRHDMAPIPEGKEPEEEPMVDKDTSATPDGPRRPSIVQATSSTSVDRPQAPEPIASPPPAASIASRSRQRALSNEYRGPGVSEFGGPRRASTLSVAQARELSHRRQDEGSPLPNRVRGRTLASRPRVNTADLRSPLGADAMSPRSPLGRESSIQRFENLDTSTSRARASFNFERPPSINGLRQRRGTLRDFAGRPGRSGTVSSRMAPSIHAPSIAYSSGQNVGEEAFTLAGPDMIAVLPANVPFVQPGYGDLNPAYEQQAQTVNARPVWGLAKPLPRVIRPGMVPTVSELRQSIAPAAPPQRTDAPDLEKGKVEEMPKLGRVATMLDEARERRESRLLSRLGSRVQEMLPTMSSDRPLSPLSPPPVQVPEQAVSEEDLGMEKPLSPTQPAGLPPLTNPDYTPPIGTEPFVPYEEDDTASTVHDDDWLAEKEEILEEELLRMDPHDVVDEVHNHHTHWSVIRTQLREPLAELLAVTVQLTLGFCADLVVTASNNTSGNEETTDWAWGLATMIGIYIAGGISGAHLNPAISIMLYVYRGFPLRKVPPYIFAQLLGAFIAGLISYGLYRQTITEYGGLPLGSGGTMNSLVTNLRFPFLNAATGFFNEFVGTAFLAIIILALGDDSNAPPGAGMNAFIIGLVITSLSMAFGYNTGAALNGTRDLGPRLALWVVGYGTELWTQDGCWFIWGPWAATISGAIVGAGIYDVLIFVGGESPVNYPKRRIKRAAHKWKKRTGMRIRNAKKRVRMGGEEDGVGVGASRGVRF